MHPLLVTAKGLLSFASKETVALPCLAQLCTSRRLELNALPCPALHCIPGPAFPYPLQVVLEEASIAGEGRFVAYTDRRLRICFEDRTILHMNSAGSYCKVPTGV